MESRSGLINTLVNPVLLYKAFDSASCGITIADATQADMPLVYVNLAFEKMTGYSAAEVLGTNCRFLQGPDHDQPAVESIRQALTECREVEVVLKNYRKDGTPFWNELRLSPVFDAQGRLTHYVGIQTDITAQRESLLEVQRQAQLFSAFLEAITFGVLIFDAQGKICLFNKAAEAITGVAFARVDTPWNLADYCNVTVAGGEQPYPREKLPGVRALAGETVAISDIEIRREDRRIPMHVNASPIRNPRGEITHVVVVFADISEIRDKENRLADRATSLKNLRQNFC